MNNREGMATATWGQAEAAAIAVGPREELRGHVAPLPSDPRVGPHGEQELVKISRTTSCSEPQDLSFLGFPTSPTKPFLLTYGTLRSRTLCDPAPSLPHCALALTPCF